jgi:hypothetical protein
LCILIKFKLSKTFLCCGTLAERVDEMVANLSEQLLARIKSFIAFSIAVDESTYVSGLS